MHDTLVLICGLPNSGKTSASAGFKKVFHLDNYAGYKGLFDAIEKHGGSAVVEGTFCVKERRKELLSLKDWDKTICIWMDTPVSECIKRENRGRPIEIITGHERLLDEPTNDEGWSSIKKYSEIER